MGWIFTIILLIEFCISGDTSLLIAAGLFAIAGTISLKQIK